MTEEKIARLDQVPLFAALSPGAKALVAEIVHRRHVTRGETIVRQGNLGTTLYIVHTGELVATALSERGENMPPRFFLPGDSFGETSLLIGEPRDATVRVKEAGEVFFLKKAEFERVVREHPELWEGLQIRPDVQLKLYAPAFSWLGKDERVEWYGRKHWIVLVRGLVLPAITWLFLVFVFWLIARNTSLELELGGLALISLLLVPWLVYLYIDWQNDYHVVTNRRVAHVEKTILQFYARQEAPLDKIQNISTRRGALGASLGYAHMTISTAAQRAGLVLFRWVIEPESVVAIINEQVRRFKAQQRLEGRQEIAQLLETRLTPAEEGTWWVYKPPEQKEQPRDVLNLMQRRRGCTSALAESALYSFLVRPHFPRLSRIEENGSIIWRKHWILLLKNIALPFTLGVLFFALTLYGLFFPFLGVGRFSLLLLSLVLLSAFFLWFWWAYEDWRNDLYIVTPTQIIDIERTPFLFYETRRQASLENIQDIRFEIPGFWHSMLNMGNVIIQTAGQGQFTFASVFDPSGVQREIFIRIEAFRERRREGERRELETELADWFSIYHNKELNHDHDQDEGA